MAGTMEERQPADESDTGMARAGARLREIRQQRKMSLVDVAKKADVTKGFLSLAERGRTNVSVPVLMRICAALEISPAALFTYPDEPMVRKGTGGPFEMGGHDVEELLLTPEDERHVQVIHTRMRPRGGSGGAYRLDADSIVVYVLEGSFSITVDGIESLLEAGDCLTFGAHQFHDWRNPTDSESEVLWTIVPPIPHEQFRFAFQGQ